MFNRIELIVGAMSVASMAFALYLIQVNTTLSPVTENAQPAQAIQASEDGIIVVPQSENENQALANALFAAADSAGNLRNMVIDDVKIGSGEEVKDGDTIQVHYAGRLQNGQEFDNSRTRGEAFEFKVGAGRVIEGWEKGVLGMKVGSERDSLFVDDT